MVGIFDAQYRPIMLSTWLFQDHGTISHMKLFFFCQHSNPWYLFLPNTSPSSFPLPPPTSHLPPSQAQHAIRNHAETKVFGCDRSSAARVVLAALAVAHAGIREMREALSRMPVGCHPLIFYERVRPFLSGWKANPTLPNGVLYEVNLAYNYTRDKRRLGGGGRGTGGGGYGGFATWQKSLSQVLSSIVVIFQKIFIECIALFGLSLDGFEGRGEVLWEGISACFPSRRRMLLFLSGSW